MYGTREDVKRWIAAPLFVAMIAVSSAFAEVKFSHVGSADAADHLFGSVVDQGANPRSTEGTVTETASQARTAAVVASRPMVLPAPIATMNETPEVRPLHGPQLRAARVSVPIRAVPARRGVVAIAASQEIRQLRQENQALKKLLADLSDRTGNTAGRAEVTLMPPGRVPLSAVVAFRQTE
jgi:hypothetical protein